MKDIQHDVFFIYIFKLNRGGSTMTTNNYTLSYDKVMLDEFYDEESKELITGLAVFLKFDHVFTNTKLTDEQLKDFRIYKPELVYVEGIGDTCLYELVEIGFNKGKREIYLNCHPFVEGKVHIVEYLKFNDENDYIEISEKEFLRILYDNFDSFYNPNHQQTLSYIPNILIE